MSYATITPRSKCFVYSRRSQDRADRQVLSIPGQAKINKKTVAFHNLAPIHLPGEDQSAYYPGRPIFNDMVLRIEKGEARYIVVWDAKRVARNPKDAGIIIQLMSEGKLLAIITSTAIYHNTPDDMFTLTLMLGLSKKESDDTSAGVKRGYETKYERKEYPSYAPTGYLNIKIGHYRNIDLDPERAPLILQVAEAAASGRYDLDSLWKFARNDLGLTSRAGNPISKSTLYDMLRNQVYKGVYKHGGTWHVGNYPHIISPDLYDRVQVAMSWSKKRISHTTKGRFYPFKGVMICATCGFNVTAYTKDKLLASGIEQSYVFYTCTKKSKIIKCDEPQLPKEELTTAIKAEISDYEISGKAAEQCKAMLHNLFDDYQSHQNRYIEVWQHNQQQAKKALNTLDQKLETGVITDERYMARSAKHEQVVARTTQQLESSGKEAERWLELANELFTSVTDIGEVFEMADEEEKRKIMLHLGSNWTLGNKKAALTVREPLSLLHKSNRHSNWRARPDLNRRSPP